MTEQGGDDSVPPHSNVDLKGKSETIALDYIPHRTKYMGHICPKSNDHRVGTLQKTDSELSVPTSARRFFQVAVPPTVFLPQLASRYIMYDPVVDCKPGKIMARFVAARGEPTLLVS